MREPRDSAENLAVRVADGGAVDWDAAERSVEDARERRVIRHLRLVESVARAHRDAGLSAAPERRLPSVGPEQRESEREPMGRSWAHLDLLERLGEGAFGEVYRAWDRRLEREVALKLLRVDRSHSKRLASTVVEEGRVLAKLRHPNVVTVYGAEIHGGRVGLWMELVRGRSLEQVLEEQGPLGPREAALVGIDVCRALSAVHRTGIVHRDVKAQNVLREEGGRILLMDFGAGIETVARPVAGERRICGTPLYMAPEILRGEPATPSSDLYALGVLLFHLVTNAFPLEAGSFHELRDRQARGEGRLLRDQRSDLPEPFLRVVERALAPDPEGRFATAGQMEQALSASLGMESDPASVGYGRPEASPSPDRRRGSRRRILAIGGALAALAALAFAFYAFRPTTVSGPATYDIEAGLYRVDPSGTHRDRLDSGARLALGDRLELEVSASIDLHVYVISEDEAGHAYVLFPLAGLEPKNPLSRDVPHRLPGSRDGDDQSWVVDTPGGREHLLVLASPTRLVEFEADMNDLARPGESAIALPESARARLRGIGGLASAPATPGGSSAGRLFEMADRLASGSEVARGVWMRRIDLENPAPTDGR